VELSREGSAGGTTRDTRWPYCTITVSEVMHAAAKRHEEANQTTSIFAEASTQNIRAIQRHRRKPQHAHTWKPPLRPHHRRKGKATRQRTPNRMDRVSQSARPSTQKPKQQIPLEERKGTPAQGVRRPTEAPSPKKPSPTTREFTIVGIRWLLREDRRGQKASSLVVYMRDPVEIRDLRMGRKLFRTTMYDWDR